MFDGLVVLIIFSKQFKLKFIDGQCFDFKGPYYRLAFEFEFEC